MEVWIRILTEQSIDINIGKIEIIIGSRKEEAININLRMEGYEVP